MKKSKPTTDAAAAETTTHGSTLLDVRQLPLGDIEPSPFNTRGNCEPDAELVASIKSKGLLEPIIVRAIEGATRPFQLVAGERRWRAAKAIGMESIAASVVVASDQEARELLLIENLQRRSLSPLEEAEAVDALFAGGLTMPEVSARIGQPVQYVFMRRRLLELPERAKKAMLKGELSVGIAHLILRVSDPTQRDEAAKRILEEHGVVTYDRARDIIVEDFSRVLSSAPFKTTDPELVPAAGACNACPKRTGAQTDLFGGVIDKRDLCTDGACWQTKVDAHLAQVAAKGNETGAAVVLSRADAKKALSYGNLRHDAAFVRADSYCNIDDKGRNYKAALGKHAPPVVLIPTPEGQVIEAYRKVDVQKAAAAAGLDKPSRSGDRLAASAKQHREKTIIDNRVREAKIAAIVVKVTSKHDSPSVLKALAVLACDAVWSDTVTAAAAARDLTGKGKTRSQVDNADALRKWLDDRKEDEGVALLAELLVRQTAGKFHGRDGLTVMAKAAGVDLAAIDRKARADVKAAADLKKKPKAEQARAHIAAALKATPKAKGPLARASKKKR